MTHERVEREDAKAKARARAERGRDAAVAGPEAGVLRLQRAVGNGVVQRWVAQRAGEGPAVVDDDVAVRIDRARGSGQKLDGAIQARMADALGEDFGDVGVHTSAESDALNRSLGARAFTTGNDVFFRAGAYEPHGSDGQRLIAHELAHVSQQRAGRVGGEAGAMTVNPPGDAFEAEADAVADAVLTAPASAGGGAPPATLQREAVPEEEEIQAQLEDEEEEEMTPA